jgi:hypothetical protein
MQENLEPSKSTNHLILDHEPCLLIKLDLKAFTWLHHNAEGLAMYVVMNCGTKIWVPISPESTSCLPDLHHLFSNRDHFVMDNDDGQKSGVGVCILLEAGDIL